MIAILLRSAAYTVIFLLLPLLYRSTATAQKKTNKSSGAKQIELRNVERQIEQTKKSLQALEYRETRQTRTLGTYKKQKQEIEKRLSLLNEQKTTLESKVAGLQRNDSVLKTTMKSTRRSFGDYLRFFHASSLSANAPSGDIATIYADCIAREMKRRLRDFDKKRASLARKRNEAVQATAETSTLLRLSADADKTLETSIQKTQESLEDIRANKGLVRRELSAKKRSAEQIRSMIAQLIEDERKREEALKSSVQKNKISRTTTNKDKNAKAIAFRWPTTSRTILRKFGQYTNKQTNTVMDNPGVDIAAPVGSAVKASAAGKVSLVHWLPGFNSLVIVDHGNGYRTVYANLGNTLVSKGQTVSVGTLIGKAGESVDGKFLHFEVWRGTDRVNPAAMLK
ncbi:M23 family metallopeptidase [Ignavibacteria bacterium]|nr:peptidoglycan DD-metalloendopeptidase family protein [Bacteroidota bacterium]MCZ2132821.1 peptidoglycan DD-metalloendopeptidase family protein [Bacteroidota bacterium]